MLVVLTTDTEEVLSRVLPAKGLGLPHLRYVSVEPELWTAWGLANSRRPMLPHPTTVVVAPDGTIVDRETHTDYKLRASPQRVLDRIAAHRGGAPTAPSGGVEDDEPPIDWAGAVSLEVRRTAGGVAIELVVKPGFHVYGAAEQSARPLAVTVHDRPGAQVQVPPGRPVSLGEALGDAHVLDGTILLDVAVPSAGADDPLTGDLAIQICTETACSPPGSRSWASP